MKRRTFLHTTSAAVSLPILLNGMNVSAVSQSTLFNAMNLESDRALVLIQLNGGNDGLNTLIPLDQYDQLANVRSNVLVPENSIIPVTNTLGFHPSMTGLKGLYDDAKVGIIQSVGYPNQNRSHFRSTDIWTSGSPADEFWTTGWLGNNYDLQHPSFPENYPNEAFPDPIAITMGSLVSQTCQGVTANYSIALNDPFALSPLAESEENEVPDTPYGQELTFLRDTIAQTNAYSETVVGAAESGNNMAAYPDENRLAQQLKNVALLVSGGLKTKVYVVNIGGFDTHANQVGDSTTTGVHATLLEQLSTAIAAFQEDLKLLGIEDKVVGMTFSEFGRRIRSNGSAGTDHGTAAPLIMFGACVTPEIYGDNPEIPDNPDVQEGVPMQYDFRDVYGSVLKDWFEVSEADIMSILHPAFQYIPILQPCTLDTSTEAVILTEPLLTQVLPNPFSTTTTISFTLPQKERVRLSIFDALGSRLKVLMDKDLPIGEHSVRFDGRDLAAGHYFYRIQTGSGLKTKGFVKM